MCLTEMPTVQGWKIPLMTNNTEAYETQICRRLCNSPLVEEKGSLTSMKLQEISAIYANICMY